MPPFLWQLGKHKEWLCSDCGLLVRLEKTLSEKTASRKFIIFVFLAIGIIFIFKRRKQMLGEEMMQTLTLQNLDSHG